jgi:hypothetical protein
MTAAPLLILRHSSRSALRSRRKNLQQASKVQTKAATKAQIKGGEMVDD